MGVILTTYKSWDDHPSTSYKYMVITPIRTVLSPQIAFIYNTMELQPYLQLVGAHFPRDFRVVFHLLTFNTDMQRSAKGGTMRLLVTLTHRWPYPCHETRIGVCFTCFRGLRTWIFVLQVTKLPKLPTTRV